MVIPASPMGMYSRQAAVDGTEDTVDWGGAGSASGGQTIEIDQSATYLTLGGTLEDIGGITDYYD